jgi:NADPH-dependent glutamate synthase beta subunit-like oxidoreductase/Pyruvate/2-oxoacid:ferredoxin oxidoreductase delta subunit
MTETALTFRRYEEGDDQYEDMVDNIFNAGWTHKCPTYINKTPPCQGECPSGHDIRGWLNIVSGIEKPTGGMSWQEYAFRRMTDANPFPALMGLACPAPCQTKCNRNDVDDHVGINSVEHFIGIWALENGMTFPKPEKETGKKVAVIGGGPAGLACAYQLRRKGHTPVVFEANAELGGMLEYGLSGHRCPRDIVHKEVQRILDMGVEARCNTAVGVDVSVEQLDKEFDAVFWGIGAQVGNPVPVPGWDEADNCVDGLAYLRAYNEGRLQYLSGRTLIIGGGNTAMDCVGTARRLGHKDVTDGAMRPEEVILGRSEHPKTPVAQRGAAEVWIVYRRPFSAAPADQHEKDAIIEEGVEIHERLAPVEIILGEDGRATALRVIKADWSTGKMVVEEGSEFNIECDLIIAATGQSSVFTGIEDFNNGKGLFNSDNTFQIPSKAGHFVGGDAVYPDLLTTAIGHAWKASEGIDVYLQGEEVPARPRIDVHHFDIEKKLAEVDKSPAPYAGGPLENTDSSAAVIHNYEDRSHDKVITSKSLFLGHFEHTPCNVRKQNFIGPDCVGSSQDRLIPLTEEEVLAEAKRCMSCGMCFDCGNCVNYCPQRAVYKVTPADKVMARFVDTDYSLCIGCHICMDVCPTGYIQMGLGEGE